MKSKIVFCRIGWMEFYKGLRGDFISGGGSFVDETGLGFEAFNFLPISQRLYGYFRPPGSNYNIANLKLENLGAKPEQDKIDGITIIWFSKKPLTGGQFIIGWYYNGTLYRSYHKDLPKGSNRIIPQWNKNEILGYYSSARYKNCVLLTPDQRIFEIPTGKGWSGQSNIWYCNNGSLRQKKFLERVWSYIISFNDSKPIIQSAKSTHNYQPDIKKRKEIEEISMSLIARYFSRLGYRIRFCQNEKLGYDIQASGYGCNLLIEVKGLNNKLDSVELTPNEFLKMNEAREDYRIGIVAECLSKNPKVYIFHYSSEKGKWIDQHENSLNIEKRTGARLYLVHG